MEKNNRLEKKTSNKTPHLEPRGRIVPVARPLTVVDDDDGCLHGSLVRVFLRVEWEREKEREKMSAVESMQSKSKARHETRRALSRFFRLLDLRGRRCSGKETGDHKGHSRIALGEERGRQERQSCFPRERQREKEKRK